MSPRRALALTRPACLAAVCVLGAPQAGFGSDGNLQAVLLEAGCPRFRLETLFDRDGVTSYRANCFGSAHKLVIVTCIKGVCVRESTQEKQPE
ncbi:hypothetical protein [Bosea sp. (in: a-proteobacteria)]|uniref:hypothetical protein n=1 Tax=Bosea sp. (in: a-proteobacteria) TaxID=1871050 RepID=UPI001AC99236|nr:hypothetical protein [Bosea sp. (in: a-proteobacteria)]MBN9438105.1 hypothetical protein [Bosea sp. (in: a-proteobacteria)]